MSSTEKFIELASHVNKCDRCYSMQHTQFCEKGRAMIEHYGSINWTLAIMVAKNCPQKSLTDEALNMYSHSNFGVGPDNRPWILVSAPNGTLPDKFWKFKKVYSEPEDFPDKESARLFMTTKKVREKFCGHCIAMVEKSFLVCGLEKP